MKLSCNLFQPIMAVLWIFMSSASGQDPNAMTGAASPSEPALTLGTKTRNVFLVMPDGLRWQEVFRGADAELFTKENHIEKPDEFKARYWRETPEERREVLMPFLWSTIGKHGQVFGNRDKGSAARITNPYRVSYPGYSETLCGYFDPTIENNRKIPNPNITVFEWLHQMPEFKGKVAGFGAWDVFPFIFNTARSGIPIDDGMGPIMFGKLNPTIETMNRVRRETPYRWAASCFDSMVFIPAMEWVKENRPRLLFLCLGETDEWGHEGWYDQYLRAATRVDSYLAELWSFAQSTPGYRDQTTLIVVPDHGRGTVKDGKRDWPNHGKSHPGSEEIFLAIIGPDTPGLGERTNCDEITLSQIAATIAAVLGKDYRQEQPLAGAPIADVIGRAVQESGD